MKKVFFVLALLSTFLCHAQEARYVDFFPEGDNVVITYHLTADASTITVFLSENDGPWQALSKVSGDVGSNIPAGDKRIVWDIYKEKPKGVTDNVRFAVVPNYGNPSLSSLPYGFPKNNAVLGNNKAYGYEITNYKKQYAGDIRKGTWASATDNISYNIVVYEYDFITGETNELKTLGWSGRVARKEPSGSAVGVSFPVVKEPEWNLKVDKKGRVYLNKTLVSE